MSRPSALYHTENQRSWLSYAKSWVCETYPETSMVSPQKASSYATVVSEICPSNYYLSFNFKVAGFPWAVCSLRLMLAKDTGWIIRGRYTFHNSDRGDFWALPVEMLVFASPTGYMFTSSCFPLLNWGIFYEFL